MPFNFRDKAKLADKLRGKTGEEIFNQLESDLDTDRKMFFDSPSWRSRTSNNSRFARGFPFDGDRNRINIRTFLDETAARHPEFADQLKERSWGEDFIHSPFGRKRRVSNSEREDKSFEEVGESSQTALDKTEHPKNLSNYGLRNTVPLGRGLSAEEERRHRSMSAPPDSRSFDKPKRFVTTCEIPVMNEQKQETVPPNVDLSGKGASETTQQKPNNGPNVRVIPIQVEGRDTPLVNANIDTATNFGTESFRDSGFDARLPRDFGTYQKHSPRFAHKERARTPPQHQYAPQYQQYVPHPQYFGPLNQPQSMPQKQQFGVPQQQAFAHQQHSQKPPAASSTQQQHYHSQSPKIPQGDEPDSKSTSSPPPPPPPTKPEPIKDPIEKVQVIQKEIEELMKQVEAFNGSSRTDKQYLMLDELLTRQLLHLDNIDTEGKENVRQARKDAIRSIQRCISTLENKVPLPENIEPLVEQSESQLETKTGNSESTHSTTLDKTKENTLVENKENQKMEVDEKESKEQQPQVELQQQQPQQPQNNNEKV